MDWVLEVICNTQGSIYKYAANHKYDMGKFSESYLSSSFCERAMDSDYSRFQFSNAEECLDFIIPEIGDMENSWEFYFDPNVAYWIGWTYRHVASSAGIPSNELVKVLPFNAMCAYYPGLHTISEDQAYDIILENLVTHGFHFFQGR